MVRELPPPQFTVKANALSKRVMLQGLREVI